MKLDRNIPGNDGRGKYALLLLRQLAAYDDQNAFGGLPPEIEAALTTLESAGIIDWGTQGAESEFFVIRLKDKNAQFALRAYATECALTDREFANEVFELANRAGPNSKWCKEPD